MAEIEKDPESEKHESEEDDRSLLKDDDMETDRESQSRMKHEGHDMSDSSDNPIDSEP